MSKKSTGLKSDPRKHLREKPGNDLGEDSVWSWVITGSGTSRSRLQRREYGFFHYRYLACEYFTKHRYVESVKQSGDSRLFDAKRTYPALVPGSQSVLAISVLTAAAE